MVKLKMVKTKLTEMIEKEERKILIKYLKKHSGDIPAIARDLGVDRQNVYRRAKKLDIDIDKFR